MNSRIGVGLIASLFKSLTILFLFLQFTPTLGIANVILTNQPLTDEDQRYDYPKKLLTEVLKVTEKQYGRATIQESRLKMGRDRTLRELEKGINIHVMAEASKPAWEQRLIPIRVPIRKGIQGYRIFLILKKNQNLLSKIKTLQALKKVPMGSGLQWATKEILEKTGFDIRSGNNYGGLFSMLIKERFVIFGRGINEVNEEYTRFKSYFPELAIEQELMLYIPLPTYFFVTPTRPELAERISLGMQLLITNGTFDKIFEEEFSEAIENANLKGRRIFSIDNPNLSLLTPLNIDHYWYHP